MKFPITREALQEFDPAMERAKKAEEEIQRMIESVIENLCAKFEQELPHTYKTQQYVWRFVGDIRNSIRNLPNQPQQQTLHLSNQPRVTLLPAIQYRHNMNVSDYLPIILEKLQKIFIGCNIITDPLKTYIIIDWS